MQYPLLSEYRESILNAEDNFDKLSHLRPILDANGEPVMSSGNFAVVFKMTDGKKDYAVKCFTKEQEGRAEAYQLIAEELEYVNSRYITTIKYFEKELFVDCNGNDNEFPVLLMDWIEGESMENFIADNYQNSYAMSMLCYHFCKMAAWLRSQPFAHGDLKPDNIMICPDGDLALVDYDGMFVPAMKRQKSPTIGTKNFSHPLRTVDDFDETIDDLALASIALSLKAISLNSSLYTKYCVADRLLFSANDYIDLSKSEPLKEIQSLLTNNEITKLLSLFLLSLSAKNLSMCSFRTFNIDKPKEILPISTEVTKEELDNAIEDEYGVKYSKDWKKLLEAPSSLRGSYIIKAGTICVGNMAFYWCKSLKFIEIPNSVTSIGSYAFGGCTYIGSIEIPNSVTSIGDSAFHGCESLSSIEIPNSVTSIGNSAFLYCRSLRSIEIPDSVTSIGDRAFAGCESLSSIEIPNSVTSIGNSAFVGCDSLRSIEIPNSVTSIGDGAFSFCESLRSIEIPNNVTSIGNWAFFGCSSLRSEIKEGLEKRFPNLVFWWY